VFNSTALYAYLGTFLLLVGAGFGLPIPEELPIVLAGGLVGHDAEEPPPPPQYAVAMLSASPQAGFPGNLPWLAIAPELPYEPPARIGLRWWIMLPICILGVVVSDGLLYGIGRFWGPRILEKRWMQRLLPSRKRQRIEQNFHQYGVLVLLFARFLPAIRSPIFIMAGVMRLSFKRFLFADGIYAIPGVSLLFTLAFWFGNQFRDLVLQAEGKIERLRPVLILIGLTAVASYLVYNFLHHPMATGDPSEDLPLVGGQIAAKMGPKESESDHKQPEPRTNGVPETAANVEKRS
jgi:membrane protein DedA with SNARE-associated domain